MIRQQTNTKGRLLKTGEAATLLHVSPQTLRDWTDNNLIPAQVTETGHRQYYEADVHRRKLQLAGTTTYWTATLEIALEWTGVIHYPTKLQTYQTEFARYWDYTNGLQKQPHLAALSTNPVTIPIEHTNEAYLYTPDDDRTNTMIAYVLTVVGLDKTECEKAMSHAYSQAATFLRENFQPRRVIQWEDNTGRLVEA